MRQSKDARAGLKDEILDGHDRNQLHCGGAYNLPWRRVVPIEPDGTAASA
ncbi:hypothetical protein [Streptomyces sp. NPDC054849]